MRLQCQLVAGGDDLRAVLEVKLIDCLKWRYILYYERYKLAMIFYMLSSIFKKLFGTSNDRLIKTYQKDVDAINALEPELAKLSDAELKNKTAEFKAKLAEGASLEDILHEAFAVVREAAKRVLGMRHFDVQLIGGMVLHKGMIAEMKMGEGKTLVATLAVYLNALTGAGVHVITVNDYLAKRDSDWMGKVYTFLGLSVGCIYNGVSEEDRRQAYVSDITYGTNNEFGFDYLRDNLKYSLADMVQRSFNFAIVDEVDSILIDEARTPLVISGAVEDNTPLYKQVDKIIPSLEPEHYEIDEKSKAVSLTDQGNIKVEALLKEKGLINSDGFLYELENMAIVHHVNQALRAHKLFKLDVDYMAKDGKLMIIDEFTGRIMEGRRYSEGLHQALEAKENLPIQNENQTIASITFQNYFRMYKKLAGMTGTAMTEAHEFTDIYKLEVISIPTNNPIARIDEDDKIYGSLEEKDKAIVAEIEQAYAKGQPVLVGTVSVERSEYLSNMLKKKKINHNVLNARFHEQEAEIIAQAGHIKAVTIATNMAGRGTDIMLGGNADMLVKAAAGKNEEKIRKEVEENKTKVKELGGLLVIGTERHESRRIDNQLRGRSGRQGDPGRTVFYLSLEDDLMRIFGTDKLKGLFLKMGLKPDEAIHAPMLTRSVEKAQVKVESRNYDIRKNLLKYDDVMNDQRKVIYDQRKFIIADEKPVKTIKSLAMTVCEDIIPQYVPHGSMPEQWDIDGLKQEMHRVFNVTLDEAKVAQQECDAMAEFCMRYVEEHFDLKAQRYAEFNLASIYRHVQLVTLDYLWRDHLHKLDHLRTGIGLRAYGQKDPLNEYKMETFQMFKLLLDDIAVTSVLRAAHLEISHAVDSLEESFARLKVVETRFDPAESQGKGVGSAVIVRPAIAKVDPAERDPQNPGTWGKISRNDICPCGSGKKYKFCHGAIAA
jgi:preprotein translocase subunit SecA